MQLQFERIAVRAIGLLDAPPGAPGFSLLVIVSAEFPPVQLGLGFMLVGVGGLLGINRTVAVEALRAGLKTGALGAVLSPPDPKANAGAAGGEPGGAVPAGGGPARVRADRADRVGLADADHDRPVPRARAAVAGAAGRARAACARVLPEEREPIVRLQVDVLGVIDFDQQTAAVDATLVDSRLAQFALTGDMALRMSWGAQARRSCWRSAASTRASPRRPGSPRCSASRSRWRAGDNPKLRLEAYLALTSNTVQFGARVDVGARAGSFSIAGFMSFDALVTLSPLAFVVDIAAKLAVKAGGHTLLSISARAHPQRAAAVARPRPRVVLDPVLRRLLRLRRHDRRRRRRRAAERRSTSPRSCSPRSPTRAPGAAQLPAGADVVTLRALDAGTAILAHPLATLQVRQRVAPLDRTLDRFGTSVPSGAKRFRITLATIGGVRSTLTPLQDRFAPAQFTAMSDDAKLSARLVRGDDLRAPRSAPTATRPAPPSPSASVYEQALVTAGRRRRRPATSASRSPLDVFAALTATTPRRRPRLRRPGRRMTSPALAAYTFLPWVQGGVSRSIAAADEPTAALAARVTLPVSVHVDGAGDVPATVRLYGPGDVTGLERRADRPPRPARRAPPASRPATCPRSSSRARTSRGCSRPPRPARPGRGCGRGSCSWRSAAATAARLKPGSPLPGAGARRPGRASCRTSRSRGRGRTRRSRGSPPAPGPPTLLAADPGRACSRLVCPRSLEPDTAYLACLVPAFAAGVKAGLGEPVPDDAQLDAGVGRDTHRPAAAAGLRLLGVRHRARGELRDAGPAAAPGAARPHRRRSRRTSTWARPAAACRPPAVIGVQSALRVPGPDDPPAWPDAARMPFQTALERLLGTTAPDTLAPPVYGQVQAGASGAPGGRHGAGLAARAQPRPAAAGCRRGRHARRAGPPGAA